MSEAEIGEATVPVASVKCPDCGGYGWYAAPVCCGLLDNGGCCGDPEAEQTPALAHVELAS